MENLKIDHVPEYEFSYKPLRFLFALLFLLGGNLLHAANFELDLSDLDNQAARVTGPGTVDSTFSTDSLTSVTIDSAGAYTLEINPVEYTTAYIQMDIESNGAISNVKWKDRDGSQTGGMFVDLPSSYFSVENEGKRLIISGIEASIDVQTLDLSGFKFPQAGVPVPNSETGLYEYKLFPGDYQLIAGDDQIGAGLARLQLELEAEQDEWQATIFWSPWYIPGTAPDTTELSSSYFAITGAALELTGQEIQIDIDTDTDELSLIQADKAITTNTILNLFPGTYNLQSGAGTSASANFTLILDAETAAFQGTTWITDSDSSLTGAFTVLDSGIVYGDADSLHILGRSVYLNLQDADVQLSLQNGPSGAGQSGWQRLELLPGDYPVSIGNDSARVVAELNHKGKWSGRAYYLPPGEKANPKNFLHGRTFVSTPDSLNLNGMPIQLDMTALATYFFDLEDLKEGTGVIPNSDTVIFRLFPGTYTLNARLSLQGAAEWQAEMTLNNRAGGFLSNLEWKDVAGNETNGTFEQIPPENVWARLGKIVFHHLPITAGVHFRAVYAVPERKPSGSWYQLSDSNLRFKYEGEYDAGLLQAKVLDWHRAVILSPVVLSLQKDHGDNRFAVNCGSLSTGHYTLEITNEKNETFYVRFEKN